MTLSRTASRAFLASLLAAGLALALVLASQAAIHDKLVSRSSQGAAANGDSFMSRSGALSGNGRIVAFSSVAANLPKGDGLTSEAYLRDMKSGKTRLASTKQNGDPADGDVGDVSISANGRFVAFSGLGDGLPGADGTDTQVWIHDTESSKTRLVSKDIHGQPSNNGSSAPSVSASGRFVVFESTSANLPGGDGIHSFVYVRDRKQGKTKLVSKTNDGHAAFGSLDGHSIADDARRVVFESADADLPSGDGTTQHTYVRDLLQGHTSALDRNPSGAIAVGGSEDPTTAGGGRFVAFESGAANLPGGDGIHSQVYLRDIARGKTSLVSRNSAGQKQNGFSSSSQPSGDGRHVAFGASATNLPRGDGSIQQIYVRDMEGGKTRLVSRANNGDAGDSFSGDAEISLDGRFSGFDSEANNLGGSSTYTNVFRAGRID